MIGDSEKYITRYYIISH